VFVPLAALRPEPQDNSFRRVFQLLIELICSPCTSWRYHRRYVGNGGAPLPEFLWSFCIWGDPWWLGRQQGLFVDRWECWKTIRLMMYAAQASGDLAPAFIGEIFSQNNLYRDPVRLIKLPVALFFHIQLNRFLRYKVRLPQNFEWFRVDDGWDQSIVGLQLVSTFIDNAAEEEGETAVVFGATFPWDFMFRMFWASKDLQMLLYRWVRSHHPFRMAMLKHGVQGLCRRKDRRMFELFVRMEPHAIMRHHLDDIVCGLERTRGKTERLLAYFKALQATSQQKEYVMDELSEYFSHSRARRRLKT